MIHFDLLSEQKYHDQPDDFKPLYLDAGVLKEYGIEYPVGEWVNQELIAGSNWYKDLFTGKRLHPEKAYIEDLTDADEELEVHNYTGICPTNVLEISPSSGSCVARCQYCLVTDGTHFRKIHVYTNYPEKLSRSLERNKERNLFYYFSPKTEAFSETHLFNGLAHRILKAFISHYEKYPDSGVRLFIATKAGMRHLKVKYDGATVFDLLKELVSKVQMNGSIGMMPSYLRNMLEPNVAGIEERLEALQACRKAGIWAESVLCQPLIIPYLKKEMIREYMKQLSDAGVKNIKPEFFTAEIRNLVLVAQYIHHYDPEMTGEFFHPYLMESNRKHIKQRSRLAPEKKICVEKLSLIREIADEYHISISLCNWVKRELAEENAPFIRGIDKKSLTQGYRCLGYQTRLFNTPNEE